MNVGIEAVSFQPGSLVLDLPEVFASAKDEDPKKFTEGLGLREISLPDSNEDIVTLGATAAKQLMERENLDPSDIGRLDVATESSFDRSKPASTYIAGCLEDDFDGDFDHINKGERKFACISGTQALNDSLNWIQAGVSKERKAIVIATDLAFYERGDTGEATQGSGAIAMLVDKDPSITSINRVHGYSSQDETDFLKPNQQYPSVDGSRSVQVYLDCMSDAISNFESKGGEIADFSLAPFHTPFPAMVQKAAPLGFRRIIESRGKLSDLESEIGKKPNLKDFEDQESYQNTMKEWMDSLQNTEIYEGWFNRVVRPTIEISSRVGNLYTGSVHLARVSGLLSAYDEGRKIANQKILVASYGSGAQAEVHSETIQEGWKEKIGSLNIQSKLDNRRRIEEFETYVDIHKSHQHSTSKNIDPISETLCDYAYVGEGVMGERLYQFK